MYIVRTQLGGEGWFGNCVLLCTRGEGGSGLCVRTYSVDLIEAEKRNVVRPFDFGSFNSSYVIGRIPSEQTKRNCLI